MKWQSTSSDTWVTSIGDLNAMIRTYSNVGYWRALSCPRLGLLNIRLKGFSLAEAKLEALQIVRDKLMERIHQDSVSLMELNDSISAGGLDRS